MKTLFIGILLILLIKTTYSQSPFVSTEKVGYEVAGKLIELDSFILLIGKFDSSVNQYFFLNEYNLAGDLVDSKSILIPFDEGTFSLSEVLRDSILNNYYFIGTLLSDVISDIQIGIAKVDGNYELTDFFILGHEDVSERPFKALINTSNNLIIGGWATDINKAFIYEYSIDGELLNESIFYDEFTWLGLIGLIEDAENNRYISSQTKYSLTEINSETLSIVSESTSQIKDSSYLVRYVHDLNFTTDFLASYIQHSNFEVDYTNFYISRLNSSFDTLWTLDFGSNTSDILFFPNSIGITDTNNFWLSYITCSNCPSFLYEEIQHTIGIIKFNGEGEIINEYYINGEFNYGYNSITPSKDGGIYIVSSLYNWDVPSNDLDIVVFKIDSMGNFTTLNEELDFSLTPINVFPNPTTNYLYFQSEINNKTRQIVIYAIDGKEVLTQMTLSTSIRVDVTAINPGIYVYSVFEEGERVQSGKFIKQ